MTKKDQIPAWQRKSFREAMTGATSHSKKPPLRKTPHFNGFLLLINHLFEGLLTRGGEDEAMLKREQGGDPTAYRHNRAIDKCNGDA